MKCALITGITGQDGSYLAELLLEKGYEVYGMVRRSSTENFERIEHLKEKIELRQGDLLDQLSIIKIIEEAQPDEVYNLASQSFVPASWTKPILTSEFNALGTTRVLEAIKQVNSKIKYYQASSSEMFGKVVESPQSEKTPFHPRSPYAVSKVYAHYITLNYRESYGMFCCSGILFNHESPRRGKEFVTRRITDAVARIKLGMQNELLLGNLDARRDWGYAGDYVEAMWLMLQEEAPDDYVIGTGISHSVKDILKIAFESLDMDWQKYVRIDSKLYRPAEVQTLCADASKAKKKLSWYPKTSFEDLIKMMADSDLRILSSLEKRIYDIENQLKKLKGNISSV